MTSRDLSPTVTGATPIEALPARADSKPMRGPYPAPSADRARAFLRSQGHDAGDRETVRCAELANTPLWQRAVLLFLPPDDIAAAEQRGRDLVALAQTAQGRAALTSQASGEG